MVAALLLMPVGAAAQSGEPNSPWQVLSTSRDATSYYYRPHGSSFGGSQNFGVPPGSPGYHTVSFHGRTRFRNRTDGAMLADWQAEFDCGPRTMRMTQVVHVRADGTITSASSVSSPYQRVAPASPEGRLLAQVCEETRYDPSRPLPAPRQPQGPVYEGWEGYNPQSAELRVFSRSVVQNCRRQGRQAVFIADSQFGVDGDLDGDADDMVFHEALVWCQRPGVEETDYPRPCRASRCRSYLFVDRGNGLEPAWVGSDPVISAIIGLTGAPARSRDEADAGPLRWNGRSLVPTNGEQPRRGGMRQVEPDASAGSGRIDLPIRNHCVNEACSWLRERERNDLPVGAGDRLVRLSMEIGLTGYHQEHPPAYHGATGAEWLDDRYEVHVFCSRTRPAVIDAARTGYRYRIVDPAAMADGDGPRRLYVAVCHPGTIPTAAGQLAGLGYSRALRSSAREGTIRRPEEIVTLRH